MAGDANGSRQGISWEERIGRLEYWIIRILVLFAMVLMTLEIGCSKWREFKHYLNGDSTQQQQSEQQRYQQQDPKQGVPTVRH